jgi:hypothetical protein
LVILILITVIPEMAVALRHMLAAVQLVAHATAKAAVV